MAWNKYYIFIESPGSTDIRAILEQLGLGHYKPVKEVSLDYTNKPQTLFTGFYNDCLLIVHPELPFQFFTDEQSETEKRFIATFPDSEIAALVENSTVSLYSFAIIEQGVKVRMKDGSDGEVYHDQGGLLPEEAEIREGPIFEEEELEDMRADGLSEEEVQANIDHEASWRVPNLLTARYLGEPVGRIDTSKVMLTMYAS